jgi:hypothetical protein
MLFRAEREGLIDYRIPSCIQTTEYQKAATVPRGGFFVRADTKYQDSEIPQRRLRSRSRLFTENESRALKTATVIRCEQVKSKPLRISVSAFARPVAELSNGLTSRRRSYVAARRLAPSVVSAGAGFPGVCFPRLCQSKVEMSPVRPK